MFVWCDGFHPVTAFPYASGLEVYPTVFAPLIFQLAKNAASVGDSARAGFAACTRLT